MSLSTTGFAADDFATADANSDGMVTMEEGKVVHADWTAESFAALDTDGNGSLSAEEYAKATSQ
jgi:hypothetical protein